LASRAHDKHIELIYRTDPELPSFAVGDPDRLKQVLNNLVGNAIKFTDRGEVFVDATVASRSDDGIVLRVAVHDSGIGIDGADLPRLYEVFSQVDGSLVRRHGGTGLGLAICKRLLRMMGGDIEVRSEVGVGSVFTFTVELGTDPRKDDSSDRADGVSGKRVLIVEASRRWREVIAEHLEAWRMEHEVAEAGSSVVDRLAQAADRKRPFDALVIGTEQTDAGVVEIIQDIRARHAFRGLPIILLTTLRAGSSLGQLEREGVTQLHKPIRFSELYNSLATSLVGPLARGGGGAAPAAASRRVEQDHPSSSTTTR